MGAINAMGIIGAVGAIVTIGVMVAMGAIGSMGSMSAVGAICCDGAIGAIGAICTIGAASGLGMVMNAWRRRICSVDNAPAFVMDAIRAKEKGTLRLASVAASRPMLTAAC